MALFGNDPWWIVLIKVLGIFVFLLVFTIFNVWFERRVVGKMQHRKGPIMNGPLGLGQALGDGAKLILKEDFRPAGTDKWVFNLAPFLTGVAAFTAWAVIPLGGEVTMFGVRTRLQLTDLPVAVLFVLAIASVGIYGIVLAGWASSSTYALLGGLRSTAQMISYEIAMGLALVAVFLQAGTMSTSEIVEAQAQPIIPAINFPGWYALLLIPSFVISPADYYENGSIAFLREKAKSGEVRAFRLSTAFRVKNYERVIAELEEFSPVFLKNTGYADDALNDLEAIARQYPKATFILCKQMWNGMGNALDLMWRCKNVCLEIVRNSGALVGNFYEYPVVLFLGRNFDNATVRREFNSVGQYVHEGLRQAV